MGVPQVLTANGYKAVTVEDYKIGCRYTTPERFNVHIGGVEAVGRPEGVKLGEIFDETYVARVSSETAGLFPVRHPRRIVPWALGLPLCVHGLAAPLAVHRRRHVERFCPPRSPGNRASSPQPRASGPPTGLPLQRMRRLCPRGTPGERFVRLARATRHARPPARTHARTPAQYAHLHSRATRAQVVAANELDDVPGQRIGLFGVVKGADEVAAAKPAPDGLIECCEVWLPPTCHSPVAARAPS